MEKLIEALIELLKEYGIYLLINTGIILSVLFGRPKTAEKLEKKRQKHFLKISKKAKKAYKKALKLANKVFGVYNIGPGIDDVNDSNEIVDIHEPWLDEVYKNG